MERRGSPASFPPPGGVHLSVRFALAEKLDVPSKLEGAAALPDLGAAINVATGGTVDAGEQRGQAFPRYQQFGKASAEEAEGQVVLHRVGLGRPPRTLSSRKRRDTGGFRGRNGTSVLIAEAIVFM